MSKLLVLEFGFSWLTREVDGLKVMYCFHI